MRHVSAGIRFVFLRLGGLLLTLATGSVIIYGALFIAPGDPATLLAGGAKPNPAVLQSIRAEFHLDDPFWRSYLRWMTSALRGDFGVSLSNRTPVSDLIASRLPTTLSLAGYAAVLILVVGLALGILAAWRGGPLATAVTSLTTALMAAPTFVVAVVLIAVFATGLGWFPVLGAGSGGLDRLWHLTLPAVALAVAWIAYVAQISQEALRQEFRSEHVVTARARGIAEAGVLSRHVLRNAAAPLLAVSGLSLAGLFASTAIAEQAFAIGGLGSLLITSAARQDIAVVQAVSLLLITAFVVINTVVDILTALLDPRSRSVLGR